MPVHATKGGFKFGNTGKTYKSKAAAQRQAAAIYSSGWRDDQRQRLARAKLHAALSAPRAAEVRYVSDLTGLLRGVHRGVMGMIRTDILPHRPKPPEPEERQDVSCGTTKGERPVEAINEALKPGLTLQLRSEDGSAREDAVKDPTKSGYSAAIAKAWGSGKLGDAIAKHLRPRVGVSFDRMAVKVNANGEKAASLIGIQPRLAGFDDMLDDVREANISLITDVAGDYLDQIRDVLEDEDNFGLPVEDLADLLEERAGVSRSRAELVAVDQTLKWNSGLMRARRQASGQDRYQWSSSLDERVRPIHAELEGQVFSYDDPPVTTKDGDTNNPGEDYRCRCLAISPPDEGEEEPEPDEEAGDEAAE